MMARRVALLILALAGGSAVLALTPMGPVPARADAGQAMRASGQLVAFQSDEEFTEFLKRRRATEARDYKNDEGMTTTDLSCQRRQRRLSAGATVVIVRRMRTMIR